MPKKLGPKLMPLRPDLDSPRNEDWEVIDFKFLQKVYEINMRFGFRNLNTIIREEDSKQFETTEIKPKMKSPVQCCKENSRNRTIGDPQTTRSVSRRKINY